jgi:hypothetical protein
MSSPRTLAEGDVHDVLRNQRRRLTLDQLRVNADGLSVRDLAERVAALETGESPPPRNIRQSVYVSLHQTHLPKLDGLGIAEYDAEAKEARLTDRAHELDAYTRSLANDRPEPEWAWYYVGVSAVGLLAMVAVSLGVPVVSAVSAPVIAAVLFVVVLALGAYQAVAGRENGIDSTVDRADPGL